VVSACNGRYFPGLLVTLYSLLKSLRWSCRANLVVLTDGLSNLCEEVLRRVLDCTGKEYSLEIIPVDLGRFERHRADYGGSRLAYARLLIPEYVACGEALYVDCDMVIRRDVAELLELSWAENCVLQAVVDPKSPTFAAEGMDCERVGVDAEARYFNSGFLWMNLGRWRERGVAARCVEFMERFPEELRWWDQSVLNAVLWRSWEPMDEAWNLAVERTLKKGELIPGAAARETNVHYLGPDKPWLGFHPYRAYFDAFFREIAHSVPRELLAYQAGTLDRFRGVHFFARRAFRNYGSICKQRLKRAI